jgi:hypothetical protein
LILGVLLIGASISAADLAMLRRMSMSVDDTRHRPVQASGDGYVSSDSCRACHPSQYASWYASYHRTMTTVASPSTIHADFSNVTVDTSVAGDMRLSRADDQFTAEFADPDNPGARISRRVVLVTGSHQQQVYWYSLLRPDAGTASA